jgi:cytidylate kinase
MFNNRLVVTVDGVAASGKTALARGLAEKLHFEHLNSGLLYRAVAWAAYQRGIDLDCAQDLSQLVATHRFELVRAAGGGGAELLIDGIDRSQELTSEQISAGASLVARHAGVRALLLPAQKEAFPGSGLVAEGRDMGTVVFPDAPVKFFVTAALDVRVQRRAAQLLQKGESVNLEIIRRDLEARDERDAGRSVAPLKVASGAIVIDNSDQPIGTILERMYQSVQAHVPR